MSACFIILSYYRSPFSLVFLHWQPTFQLGAVPVVRQRFAINPLSNLNIVNSFQFCYSPDIALRCCCALAVYFQVIVMVRCKPFSAVNFHQGFATLLSSSFHAGGELSVSREMSAWLNHFIHLIHGAVSFQQLQTCQRTRITWVCSSFTVAHNVSARRSACCSAAVCYQPVKQFKYS